MSNSGGPYFFTTPHLEAQTKVPSDREERRLDLIAQLCGDRGAYMQKHDPNYGYVPGGWFQVRNYGEPHNSLARARAIKYLNMDPKVLTITALRKMIKEKEFTARDEAIYYNLTGRIYTD